MTLGIIISSVPESPRFKHIYAQKTPTRLFRQYMVHCRCIRLAAGQHTMIVRLCENVYNLPYYQQLISVGNISSISCDQL